jgi:hypothetical protein
VDYFKTCITGPSTSNSPSGNFFLDPREIVLLFKDLHEGSYSISGHLKYGTAHKSDLFKGIYDDIKMKSNDKIGKSYEQSLQEAKQKFLPLFESINSRYIAELRTNPDAEAVFTYSKFSPVFDTIKTDKGTGTGKKFSLVDILEVV